MARARRRAAAVALALACALLAAAQPAAAWRVNSTPVWSSPYPGQPWTFQMRVNNTGNVSIFVTGFNVWTNWGDPPTQGQPQHTSTALPVPLAEGANALFRFTINVPVSAAGQQFHLYAVLTAASSNGSGGWTAPVPGAFPGWNFTVLSANPAPGANNGGSSPLQSNTFLVGLSLAAIGAIGLAILATRQRRNRSGRAARAGSSKRDR